MTTATRIAAAVLAGALGFSLAGGCGSGDKNSDDDSDGPVEQTGSACDVVDDCFPDVDPDLLAGEAQCLDRVRGGYCTHLCETDADCCAAEGECETDLAQVCAPFESTGLRMCFLSCERDDLVAPDGSPDVSDQEHCQRGANSDFICRSSGGGSNNQKICVPGDCGVGADCARDADCDADLSCVLDFQGGYCGAKDCENDALCPDNSHCVEVGDGSTYCLRTCEAESDCTFCRGSDVGATCVDRKTFAGQVDVRVCEPSR